MQIPYIFFWKKKDNKKMNDFGLDDKIDNMSKLQNMYNLFNIEY